MKRRSSIFRALMTSAAIALSGALGGCLSEGLSIPDKALKELSPEMVKILAQKNMPKETDILVRVFKEEAELEVWKKDSAGQYALLKTYPICRWSGELGPKMKEGDRQAPEGFYTITPGQMNPNSQYFLSFNLGYPNAFDKAHNRTGAHLMVHGDCSSRGCYAMTDEQIGEIYALARESFMGGQRAFQVQAYPFRMTPVNFARHRNSPHMAFWRSLKQGHDHFEVTRQEPKVDVCEKRYVFDAVHPTKPEATLKFDPKGRCPAYTVPQEIASAVEDKRLADERQVAELVSRGTPTAPIRTGADGGMHPTFLAKLKRSNDVVDNDGRVKLASAPEVARLGRYTVVPPRTAETTGSTSDAASESVSTAPATVAALDSVPMPRSGPQPKVGDAEVKQASLTDRIFGGLFKSRDEQPTGTTPVATQPAPAAPSQGKPAPRPRSAATDISAAPAQTERPRTAPLRPASEPAATSAATSPKPAPAPGQTAASPEPSQPATASMLSGQPMAPTSNFATRWNAFR